MSNFASARVSREKVLAICTWAKAKIEETRREKDGAFLQRKVRERNWWRRLLRLRVLTSDEIHERLLRETDSFGLQKHNYPWRCWWEQDFDTLLTLARDAEGGIRVSGEEWRDMLRWCRDRGWRDADCPEQGAA